VNIKAETVQMQGLTDRTGHQQGKMICISLFFGIYVRCTQTVSASHQSSWLSSEARWNSGMDISSEIEDSGTNKYNLIRLQSIDKRHPTPTTQLCVWSRSLPLGYNSTSGRLTAIESLRYICTRRQVPAPTFLECSVSAFNLKQRHHTLPG
jgi:hypothetical protein